MSSVTFLEWINQVILLQYLGNIVLNFLSANSCDKDRISAVGMRYFWVVILILANWIPGLGNGELLFMVWEIRMASNLSFDRLRLGAIWVAIYLHLESFHDSCCVLSGYRNLITRVNVAFWGLRSGSCNTWFRIISCSSWSHGTRVMHSRKFDSAIHPSDLFASGLPGLSLPLASKKIYLLTAVGT